MEENKSVTDLAFNAQADILAGKKPDMDDEDDALPVTTHKTLTQAEAEPNLSDMQVIKNQLFPDTGDPELNTLMMSRTLPDSYIPLQAILVKSRLLREPDKSFDQILTICHTAE